MSFESPQTRDDFVRMLGKRTVSQASLDELNRFGELLMSEVMARWAGIETKAQIAMGFSIAVAAFVAGQAAKLVEFSPWGRLPLSVALAVALIGSLCSAWYAYTALKVRSVKTIGAGSWICEAHLDRGRTQDMSEFHLVETFETYLALHDASKDKALFLKKAQATLIVSGLALGAAVLVTTVYAWAGGARAEASVMDAHVARSGSSNPR